MSIVSIFDNLEEKIADEICTACDCCEYDSETGFCDCISRCGGDYTDKRCRHYNDFQEIQEIFDAAGQEAELIISSARDKEI